VRIVSLSTSLSLIDASESDMEAFLRFVPWAEAMGIPWLRVFDGGRACDSAELERASAVVSRWKALRASRGWKADIMVETHDALATSSAIMRFVEAVPGVRMLWDTHHTWRTGGERPSDTWRAIAPSVVHLHVKDSQLADKPGSPSFYRLPGTGDFPMGELLGALGGAYSGAVSLEWERMWHPELPPLDEALRSAAALSWW
jgi:sugar phosphate isomerase/epimerase